MPHVDTTQQEEIPLDWDNVAPKEHEAVQNQSWDAVPFVIICVFCCTFVYTLNNKSPVTARWGKQLSLLDPFSSPAFPIINEHSLSKELLFLRAIFNFSCMTWGQSKKGQEVEKLPQCLPKPHRCSFVPQWNNINVWVTLFFLNIVKGVDPCNSISVIPQTLPVGKTH